MPSILKTGRNRIGPEQSRLGCKARTSFQFRRLWHRTSSWNLILGSSKKRSYARRRKSGSFWCFQKTSVASWIQDRPQSGHYKNSNHSKANKAEYLCQIGDSDHMRPPGISQILRTSANPSIGDGQIWFSTVTDHSPTLTYTAPLQKKCPCAKTHRAMRGTFAHTWLGRWKLLSRRQRGHSTFARKTSGVRSGVHDVHASDGLFFSQSATSLSSKFWKQCLTGL